MPKNLTTWIGIAIVAGLVAGLASAAVPGLAAALSWLHILGDVFVAALKMLVVPVILSSLVVGVTSIGDITKVGRMGGRAATYYLTTTMIAIGIGLVLVNICLLYTSPSPRDQRGSRMPSSA